MKTNSYAQKSPSEIASELFQGTKVESAFDKKGKFSHLLARLSKNEFFKLYSPSTTVTIFIQGYWLQLCLKDKKKKILNRETNTYLTIEISENDYGFTILELFHLEKCAGKFKLRSMIPEDLLETTEGYYALARAAVRVFTKIQSSFALQKAPMRYLPVVQIMPEEDLEFFFDASLVNIQ